MGVFRSSTFDKIKSKLPASKKSPALGRRDTPSTGAASGDPSSGTRARVSNAGRTSISANIAGRPVDDRVRSGNAFLGTGGVF